MRIGTGEAPFLQTLFDTLERAGLRYAVMRNYETLPLTAGGSDLDLLVSVRAGNEILAAILQVVDKMGAVAIGQSSSFGFRKVCVAGRDGNGDWWGLRIDVNCGLAYKGARLLKEDFSSAVESHRGLAVLNPGLAGVLGVLKEILNNGTAPARYMGSARAAAADDWGRVERLLAPMGPSAVETLRRLLIAGVPGPCPTEASRLRSQLARQAIRIDRGGYVRRRFLFEVSKFRRYLSPSGAMVAVLGVDGVGKSTVIEGIVPVLQEATHGACLVKHLRPGLLPPLSRLKGERRPQQGPVIEPHGSTPSGTLGSLMRVGWLLADYVLGYWVHVRPFVAKQPAVFLFDRYAYDMAIDPRRFRIGLSPGVIARFARLAPRPDLVLCLHAIPSVILGRKQELPEAEVRRQLDALRAFAARNPRAVMVSTEGSPDEVRDRVLHVLLDFFGRRDRARRVRLNAT